MTIYKIALPPTPEATPSDVQFEAFQWTGDFAALPDWAAAFETKLHPHWGQVLHVGPYIVRTSSWVLRSLTKGDIFALKEDMFNMHYEPVEIVDEK